jgi:hypothetical protein
MLISDPGLGVPAARVSKYLRPRRLKQTDSCAKWCIAFGGDVVMWGMEGDDLFVGGDSRNGPKDKASEGKEGAGARDPFGPPEESCECHCLHCGRNFMSDLMWFQRVINARDGFEGFWMCPTANCGGSGFTFDIFPTDPDHPANAGWHFSDDDGEYDDEEGEFDPGALEADVKAEAAQEWDPDEPVYKELDEVLGEEDDDIEGEEWKFGLEPGEAGEVLEGQQQPGLSDPGRREWEEEQKKYDMPDERPRVVDWKDREEPGGPGGQQQFGEDDIPF